MGDDVLGEGGVVAAEEEGAGDRDDLGGECGIHCGMGCFKSCCCY